jgi:molybdenum cofactor cytidylyltransferase
MSEYNPVDNVGVVVLAAGSSSRLGQPKQLIKYKGKPLLQNILDHSQVLSFTSKVLILGAYAEEINKNIDTGEFKVIINEQWEEGIASSIREGVRSSWEINPNLENILFLLSDQPFVTSALIKELLDTHKKEGKTITGCRYDKTVGVPVIFNKNMFQELCHLNGDRGAKVLIRKYPDKVAAVSFDLGSVDVDEPDDYTKLLKLND